MAIQKLLQLVGGRLKEYLQTWWRAVVWWCKNPFHNLTFYVLGVVGKPFERVGRYPKDNFSPAGGWNWTVIRYSWLRLPFVSYFGWCKFYVGWRERGDLGVKLTRGEKTAERAAGDGADQGP